MSEQKMRTKCNKKRKNCSSAWKGSKYALNAACGIAIKWIPFELESYKNNIKINEK